MAFPEFLVVPVLLSTLVVGQGDVNFPALGDNGACPNDLMPAYLITAKTFLAVSKDTETYNEVSEAECIAMCSDNMDRERLQVPCQSATYEPKSHTCKLHNARSRPRGDSKLSGRSGFRHYEKFCLPSNARPECVESLFYRHRQAILVGSAYELLPADSADSCLSECVQRRDCKSVMYFWTDRECILNKKTASQTPALFFKEETEDVEYYENGCFDDVIANLFDHTQPLDPADKRALQPEEPKDDPKTKKDKNIKIKTPRTIHPPAVKPKRRKQPKRSGNDKDEAADIPVNSVEVHRGKEERKGEVAAESEEGRKIAKVTQWSQWSPCEEVDFTRKRTRKCHGEGSCESSTEQVQECEELKGWSAWSDPCKPFGFEVADKCLGFRLRVCLSHDKSKCKGPHYKYCFLC